MLHWGEGKNGVELTGTGKWLGPTSYIGWINTVTRLQVTYFLYNFPGIWLKDAGQDRLIHPIIPNNPTSTFAHSFVIIFVICLYVLSQL